MLVGLHILCFWCVCVFRGRKLVLNRKVRVFLTKCNEVWGAKKLKREHLLSRFVDRAMCYARSKRTKNPPTGHAAFIHLAERACNNGFKCISLLVLCSLSLSQIPTHYLPSCLNRTTKN